jgi:Tol biopolymer transport system component
MWNKGWPNVVSVWRVPVDGGEEVKVLDSVHIQGQWTVGKRGIYFLSTPDKHNRSDVRFYDFATSKIRKLLTIEGELGYSISVSPDGQTIVYTQFDGVGSDLMLVENFR